MPLFDDIEQVELTAQGLEMLDAAIKVAYSTEKRVAFLYNSWTGQGAYVAGPLDRVAKLKRQQGYDKLIWIDPKEE